MAFAPDIHHRRSIRVKEYNYSDPGAYFITICTGNKARLFGEILNGNMFLNNAGSMVHSIWNWLPQRFPFIALDQFVAMPNHIHGVIIIEDDHPDTASDGLAGKQGEHKDRPYGAQGKQKVRPHGTAEDSVGRIVQAFQIHHNI